jgi:hypothetical protein
LGVKRWSDEDNFDYVGSKHQINLSQYLEQKSVPIPIFIKADGIFVKINVILTVRETKSAVTTSEEAILAEESSESQAEE